jgi:serine/threonine protein kinase
MTDDRDGAGDGPARPSNALRIMIDQARAAYLDAWDAAPWPAIEAFLGREAGAGRAALLYELILTELDLRQGRGPGLAHYLARFPGDEAAVRAAFVAHAVPGSDSTASWGPRVEPPPPEKDQGPPPDGTTQVGRYTLLGELARGGNGVVHKGRDPGIRRNLAVKFLRAEYQNDENAKRRLAQEARIAGKLHHPGIAPVHELGDDPLLGPFFTMRLVKGKTLTRYLGDKALEAKDKVELLDVLQRIAETVAYAHERKLVHRDLKPDNVMVGRFGEVVVIDWGIAKPLKRPEQTAPGTSPEGNRTLDEVVAEADLQTVLGTVVGTPGYMAPEQALGENDRIDARTDVFALGAILCEILTGLPPYTGRRGLDEIRRDNLDEAWCRLDRSGEDARLVALAKACLDPESERRPRSARQVAEALAAYREAPPEDPRR